MGVRATEAKPWPATSLTQRQWAGILGEAFIQWLKTNGVAIQYIQPGKPNQNAFSERFNRTYREEVPDMHIFTSIDDVREATWW
jgi:putative transposase